MGDRLHNKRAGVYGVLLLLACVAARADLSRWIQDIAVPSKLQAAFFRSTPLPGGAVDVRRPPKETRAELTKLIEAAPSQADLYALRAHEDEQHLDFTAAENDWKKHVELAPDKPAAELSLADFYHRRLRPREEVAALDAVATQIAYERIQTLIADQALPVDLAITEYRAWVAHFPADAPVYKRFFDYLVAHQQRDEATRLVADYRKAFPADTIFPVQATAALDSRGALAVYAESFQPLWPPELIKAYFNLLKQQHALRSFLDRARNQIVSHPTDITAAAAIYYYYQQQGNVAAATRALLEYRQRKSTFTTDELYTLGQLFEGVHNYDEAARSYFALSTAGDGERGLAGIANVLLAAPEQPIRIGSGDLSYYRDIATMDPGPGFLNGVLSLLLNSTAPSQQYATENQASIAYFHRAHAAEVIGLLDARFPNSAQRASLHAKLIEAYAIYGDDAGILRAGRQFLSAFAKAPERTRVATAMADAYARQNDTRAEFAIYEDLLKELWPAPEYTQILDRYIARLVALKQLPVALALYRRQIARNSNDSNLYERFAAFLDSNKLNVDAEQVYRKAIEQFHDRTWNEKLARWYLRRKQTAQFDALTKQVVQIFSGTDLEAYFTNVSKDQPLGTALFRQVNLYAHQRFPYDLVFVRNLLSVYTRKGTADPVAQEALLRTNWFYANDLRDQYFELLSRTGRLNGMKATAAASPGAARFVAEAETWQSHFETAAPMWRSLAVEYPGDTGETTRAASIYRSLATYDSAGDRRNTDIAASLEQEVTRLEPRNAGALTTVGEIYADREQLDRARPLWNKIAEIEPGKPDGYIDAATVFWDYYRFDDALRLIAEGRRKLGKPELWAFEAGAIYENQRDYAQAVQEYAKGDGDPARVRLIELSKRTQQRQLVEDLTLKQANAADAGVPAVSLRADVLIAQERFSELEQFLLTTAQRTNSLDLIEYIDTTAARQGFDNVQVQAKQRQIALTTDPVERMQAQLALMRFYEGKHDPAAARVVDDLYKTNPTILGVVRAAAEFYWRNKDAKRSIDVLAEAAAKAQPSYRDPFMLEAARKATDSRDYARARTLLAALLDRDPFEAQYVAAMADTYARQQDDRGLRDFYTARLNALRAASLSANEKLDKTAELRRSLIPVLTRLQDYAAAMDQYIEVLNRYPEDEGLAHEAARYASAHGRAKQITDYYAKTAQDSPRDYRWPMVQARVATELEDLPAALIDYARAETLRPDRTDFYIASAGLQERLLRFDEAAATYAKLYELSYHNSQWIEKVALQQARLGQTDAAIKTLDTALIQGKPTAQNSFAVAARLESWNILPQAREYAEKGVALAGANLLTDYVGGAATYAGILTRLRQYDAVWAKLLPLSRSDAAAPGFSSALAQMGATAGRYFTPEEKLAFAKYLAALIPAAPSPRMQTLLPVVSAAGLADLEAKWRYALLMSKPDEQQPAELISLQQRRMRFDELGTQLEAYFKALVPDAPNRNSYLEQAARNYRLAGNTNGEARALALLEQLGGNSGQTLTRYAAVLSNNPQRLIAAAGTTTESATVRDALANYAIEAGPPARALDVVAARGRGLPPVWTRAYTGLTGLYFVVNSAPVNAAWSEALGTMTIGDRLGTRVDRTQQLAGDLWFYYGARYGEYLAATKQNDSEDYLPAEVEDRPASADAYFHLANYYREAGNRSRALDEYRNVLQIDAHLGEPHNYMAALEWQQGRRDAALTEWRAAITAFARQINDRRVPENWVHVVQTMLEDIGRYKTLDPLRADIDRLLRGYIRRNGDFGANELMQGVIAATDATAGIRWIADLSKAAPEPALFLSSLVSDWPALYRPLIDTAKERVARARGEARDAAEGDLRRWQTAYIRYAIEHHNPREAQAVIANMPKEKQSGFAALEEIEIAAQLGNLDAALARLAQTDDVRAAATELEKQGDHASARKVLEFIYTRELDRHELTPAAFLGLAEIRLEENNTAAAVALLRRMTLVVGEPFEELVPAADLLTRHGRTAEAAEFLQQRAKAVPWDSPPPAAPVNATSTDTNTRIRVLREAIAMNPADEKMKNELFRVALDAKRWQTVVATSAALGITESIQPGTAVLQRGTALAYVNLGDLEQAASLYRMSLETERDNNDAKTQLRNVQAQLDLRAQNRQRRPVVSVNLEQDHLVRPRLSARNNARSAP